MKKNLILLLFVVVFTSGCFGPKCPEGYTLEDDKCYTILETNAIYEEEQYCVVGTLIDGMCYVANTNLPVPAHQSPSHYYTYYYCDYGYQLRGTLCYPNATIPSTKTVTSCPYGYTKNSSGIVGVDVPHIEVPGVIVKCYKRVVVATE